MKVGGDFVKKDMPARVVYDFKGPNMEPGKLDYFLFTVKVREYMRNLAKKMGIDDITRAMALGADLNRHFAEHRFTIRRRRATAGGPAQTLPTQPHRAR